MNSGDLPSGRALGVKWDAKSDNLDFALAHIYRPKAKNTKRGILKRLAALYGSLGWASPYVVRAKILLNASGLVASSGMNNFQRT